MDDQSVLLSSPFLIVCTKSNVHTKFPHPHFISMTSIFGRREYKIRLHEVALPLTIEEEKIGDVGPSDQEGLRGRK